jgi:hypothetical protein
MNNRSVWATYIAIRRRIRIADLRMSNRPIRDRAEFARQRPAARKCRRSERPRSSRVRTRREMAFSSYERKSTMPASLSIQSSSPDAAVEPKPPPCTKCGAPTILARIERAKPGFDLRTVECSKCNNADQYIVERGTAAPWPLRDRAAR